MKSIHPIFKCKVSMECYDQGVNTLVRSNAVGKSVAAKILWKSAKMTFDANSWKFKKNRKKKMPLKYACISNSSHTETDFFYGGSWKYKHIISLACFFVFFLNIYVFASIVIFADFHRILAATGANAVKCCEISNSQMLWEIPLTAFDTLQ